MNPVIGDVVIVRRLKVDQTGDDNDPAVVNVVRLVDGHGNDARGRYRGLPDVGTNDPRMIRNAAGEAQPGNYPYGGDVPAAVMPDGRIQVAQRGISPAEEAANQANLAGAIAVAEGGEFREPVRVPEPVPPHAFISATVWSENGHSRFVRNVPFFDSPEDASLWPKPPVTPTNVDAGLVAYPKAEAE